MRVGADLNRFSEGLADLVHGRDTDNAEAVGMVIGEALSVYIRSNTKDG